MVPKSYLFYTGNDFYTLTSILGMKNLYWKNRHKTYMKPLCGAKKLFFYTGNHFYTLTSILGWGLICLLYISLKIEIRPHPKMTFRYEKFILEKSS